MNTPTKSLLFLLVVALVGFGIFIVANSEIPWPHIALGRALSSSGPVTCDFSGVTYQEGQVRAAGDGCNTCVCAETGWSCTRNACFNDGTEAVGTVSGILGKVDGAYVSDRVCAVDLTTEKKNCVETLPNTPSYSMRLPAGTYWIYAEDDARKDGYKAYYSEYVTCKDADCRDHSPIAVTVKEGEITEAQPADWSAAGWFDHLTVTPSQKKYGSYYYDSGAKFNIRTRGMVDIEFFYLFIKLTVQDHDDNPKSIGHAQLIRTDDDGWQYWELALPQGFASSRVWPVGRDKNGGITRGWDLGRIKADETMEEKLD